MTGPDGYLIGPTDTTVIHRRYRTFTGGLAFDIGANAGWLASVLAESFDTVVACEPHDVSYQHLADTAPENVRPLHVAVSDVTGTVILDVRDVTALFGELFTGEELPGWGGELGEVVCPSVTLDGLAETYGQPDFVKIDTEGHEIRILEGGRGVFANAPEFLIEIHSEANGQLARVYLEEMGLRFDIVRHQAYNSEGRAWRAHYWLVSLENP